MLLIYDTAGVMTCVKGGEREEDSLHSIAFECKQSDWLQYIDPTLYNKCKDKTWESKTKNKIKIKIEFTALRQFLFFHVIKCLCASDMSVC